jgi:hypothetical protein
MTRSFNTLLCVELLAEGMNQWRLRDELIFESDVLGTTVVVPVGFITDFASVPRAPLTFWLAGDRARAAAVVHDYLYSIGFDREQADNVFLEAMEETGISRPVRSAMFRAVRMFGGSHHVAKSKGAE